MVTPTNGGAMNLDSARELVQYTQDLYNDALWARGDVQRILQEFTDDVVTRFGDYPEIKGKIELEKFLSARVARQKNHKMRKELRALTGDIVGVWFEGTWEDAKTGKRMNCRGCEFWTMRKGKTAVWEVGYNVWPIESDLESTIV